MKNVIITGGLGNLGSKILNIFKNNNYNCIVIDQLNFKNKKKYNFYKKNKTVDIFLTDLSNINSLNKSIKKIKTKYSKIDTIINNAAYYKNDKGFYTNFEKETYESWMNVLKVNLISPFYLIQKLLPSLKKTKSASIINIGTIYSKIAPDFNNYVNTKMQNPASYSSSKGGLEQLTLWLSSYLGKYNIRVNMVSPGGISGKFDKVFINKYKKRNPLGRMNDVDDILGIIYFLASDEAKFITGQNIFVDGGYSNL
tara:strand:+ start:112 stop:873 length:762 start_codon:yes stop_codon:yes gene_type:complete